MDCIINGDQIEKIELSFRMLDFNNHGAIDLNNFTTAM